MVDLGLSAAFSFAGSNGFVINSPGVLETAGRDVRYAGNLNGDGKDDLMIGGQTRSSNGLQLTGKVYVVFGSDTNFDASFETDTIDGTNGTVFFGIEENNDSGEDSTFAGDNNADGIDDIVIGVRIASPNGTAQNGSNGFVLNGTGTGSSGISVSRYQRCRF